MTASSRAAPRVEHALASLKGVGGARGVLTDPASLVAYQADALQHRRGSAAAVLLPRTRDEVVQIVTACHAAGVPFVARGHGTGLSGGATPVPGGVVVGLARLDRIVSLDPAGRTVVVEPGVTTAAVTRAAAQHGLYFAPDPSSAEVCSIGGNIAENAGGAHCLKYGTTINHVLGLEVVLPDGTLLRLGGGAPGLPGSELIPLFVGSEGTLGIVIQATLRLTRLPEAVTLMLATFDSMVGAGEAVSRVIAAGIVPAAMEAMDRLAIRAGEPIAHASLALVDAALFIELDGPREEVAAHAAKCAEICRAAGAIDLRLATDEAERAAVWKARKAAVAGMGRISPAYLLQDGVVPRSRLPEALSQIARIASIRGLPIANVFHAGDGNLHPVICYEPSRPGSLEQASEAAAEIMAVCLRLGGSITGEHGIGLDKQSSLPKMLAPDDLETHGLLRLAIDPAGLSNPGKSIPATVPRQRSSGVPAADVAGWAESCRSRPGCGIRDGSGPDAIAGLAPAFVAEPESVAALAAVLIEASAGNVAVVVRGGGTKLGAAQRPERCDVVLSTGLLKGVIDHRPEDFVATIAAGTTIDEANAELGRSGQWLGIDPPFHALATVGGVLAANDAGPRRLRYGTPRDRVLAAHFVRPDGKLITAGRSVLKNVAGYDVARLLAGTFGAFGVLTDVSLRLSPLPQASMTVRLGFDRLEALAHFLSALGATSLEPTAVDLAFPPAKLLVRFESVAEACASEAEQLTDLARRCGASVEQLAGDPEVQAWEVHEQETWPASGLVVTSTAPPSTLTTMLGRMSRMTADGSVRLVAHGPVLAGELVIALDGEMQHVVRVGLSGLRQHLAAHGGALEIRRLPAELMGHVGRRGHSAADRVLQALKAELDPSAVLNPGLLGGWPR